MCVALGMLTGCAPLASVVTYHNDNYRSGWNQNESSLTSAKVVSSSFGQRFNIALDDQVDVQPLIVPVVGVTVGSDPGAHNVVYVATENNTIYMIDAVKGTILFHKNFGLPVPTPLGCQNNGPNVGIDGTPVIDEKAGSMYVITYTLESGQPVYRLRMLDLGSLAEKRPNVVVSASHLLSDGTTFNFNATYQRQRPGLAASQWQYLCGIRQLLRLGWQPVPRMDSGLERRHVETAGRQPDERHPTQHTRRHVPFLGLDVRLWNRGRQLRQRVLRDGELRFHNL